MWGQTNLHLKSVHQLLVQDSRWLQWHDSRRGLRTQGWMCRGPLRSSAKRKTIWGSGWRFYDSTHQEDRCLRQETLTTFSEIHPHSENSCQQGIGYMKPAALSKIFINVFFPIPFFAWATPEFDLPLWKCAALKRWSFCTFSWTAVALRHLIYWG